MSTKVKEFSSYTLESPIVKLGTFTDSSGNIINVTKDMATDIYKNLSSTAPLKDIHIDGEPIGNIQKFVLKDDGIYQKSIITDVQRFESRYGNGHCFVSPEIEIDKITGNAKLVGAALTLNPGMIQDKVMVSKHYFEAPKDDEGSAKVNTWQEPLGELKSTINTLNDTLSTFGDKVKSMNEPQVNKPTDDDTSSKLNIESVDDLAKLVNDAVNKRIASMQSPKNPEASETANTQNNPPDKPEDKPQDTSDNELAKEYANLRNELENLKKSQESAYLKQLNNLLTDMKSLGIEHPEKMVPDGVNTEQKITILESIKETFAKNSPMSAPLQEPLAGTSNGTKKPNSITIDDVLGHFDEVFGSTDGSGSIKDDPTIRHSLSKLSDPDLMRKYNMNVLFDTNGNYIGPM